MPPPATTASGGCSGSDPPSVACTASDSSCATRTGGPGNSGYKTETCSGSAYVESTTCTFPGELPVRLFSRCDGRRRLPRSARHRSIISPAKPDDLQPACAQSTPCEMCGVRQGYLDSKRSAKWLLHLRPVTAGGGKFACASYPAAWPCRGAKVVDLNGAVRRVADASFR